MTQEEKAKRYDELAKEVKDFFEGKQKMYSDITQTLEYLFPELKENEDEKIRKGIISGMVAIKGQGKETFAAIRINDCIAWLEKQGEQKPQGKTALEAIKEEKVDNQFCVKPVDKTVEEYNIAGIGSKHAQGKLGEMIKNLKSVNETLEQKPTCGKKDETSIAVNNPDAYKIGFADGEAHAKEEWSKEAENNILFLTSIIEECFKDKEEITLCDDTVCANFTKENVIDRLKSLRPQNTWKPSEEQIKHLTHVVYDAKHKNDISTYGYEPYFHLSNLLMQLKRLKG